MLLSLLLNEQGLTKEQYQKRVYRKNHMNNATLVTEFPDTHEKIFSTETSIIKTTKYGRVKNIEYTRKSTNHANQSNQTKKKKKILVHK